MFGEDVSMFSEDIFGEMLFGLVRGVGSVKGAIK